MKKKKEEDAKKEQFKNRMKQVKELEEKRKELLRKKQKWAWHISTQKTH